VNVARETPQPATAETTNTPSNATQTFNPSVTAIKKPTYPPKVMYSPYAKLIMSTIPYISEKPIVAIAMYDPFSSPKMRN